MINELKELSNSIEKANFSLEEWHDSYKRCPKGNATFIIFLSSDGTISNVESVKDRDIIQSYRKWEVSNGVSFPSFNILPLLKAVDIEAKESFSRIESLLKDYKKENKSILKKELDVLKSLASYLWGKNDCNRIEKCIKKGTELGEIVGVAPEDFKAFDVLLHRVSILDVDNFKEDLCRAISAKILSLPDNVEDFIGFLCVRLDEDTNKKPKNISIILELDDRSSFEYPVNHTKTINWINSRLIEHGLNHNNINKLGRVDSFGYPMSLEDEKGKYPKVNLPKIGNVILRAMSAESPCQKRYGHIDSASFPSSSVLKSSLKKSIEWLAADERKGKTWTDVSGLCRNSALLFAYPSDVSNDLPGLASLLIRDSSGAAEKSSFVAKSEKVVAAIDRLKKVDPFCDHNSLNISVFVLEKIDVARTKVQYNRVYSAKILIEASERWRRGAEKVPKVRLNMGTDRKALYIDCSMPFPSDVVNCINKRWTQDGERSTKVHGLSVGDGLSLMLEEVSCSSGIAQKALHLFINDVTNLLLAAGHADHLRDGNFKVDKTKRESLELLPGVLALLLDKVGLEKEDDFDMRNYAFLIGQIMSLSDVIHKGYCVCVRNDMIPPRLLGNSLMNTALTNPQKALVRLAEKLPIYKAWVDTAKKETLGGKKENDIEKRQKAFNLSGWSLRQFQNICGDLPDPIPEKTSDSEKAQMLLGYLAHVEDKREVSSEENKEDKKDD